jgi:hypothetical protein
MEAAEAPNLGSYVKSIHEPHERVVKESDLELRHY